MKCFNHCDRDAVAQCANCQKYLCDECAHIVPSSPLLCLDCFYQALVEEGNARRAEISRNRKNVAWSLTFFVAFLFVPSAILPLVKASQGGSSSGAVFFLLLFLAPPLLSVLPFWGTVRRIYDLVPSITVNLIFPIIFLPFIYLARFTIMYFIIYFGFLAIVPYKCFMALRENRFLGARLWAVDEDISTCETLLRAREAAKGGGRQ